MILASFNDKPNYNYHKIVMDVMLETSFSKEIRIALKKGQIMKEHKAPFPIIVHILTGEITFGTGGKEYDLKQGDLLTLDGKVPHDLTARTDSVVHLTLSKPNTTERVKHVITSS
ncbi:cupin domain-containing protein [Maribacter confluentis]|uniref:Cupin domain-containing protein n=1 Tax=Maribacter confluentis TaxID=1656093 RepID=A0ABT8RMB8_9FLAO|nr:cupin domain-containing protein [Maribacter confluentis]MDO1512019.1 cupin domain-containing protein [Maribacter confluentis]